MDGTLVDSEKHYTSGTYEWMKEKGFKGKLEDLYKIIGIGMEETYKYIGTLMPLSYEEIVKSNTEYFKCRNVMNYADYIFDSTIPTLKELKKMGIKNIICSMSNHDEVLKCIKDMKIEEYVDHFICSDDVDELKPNPEIYLKAIEYLGINKNEAIVVEDSYTGIAAGINADILTYARKDTVYGMDQSNTDKILMDLFDIVSIVRKLNGK